MKTYLCNIIGKANVDLEKVKRKKKDSIDTRIIVLVVVCHSTEKLFDSATVLVLKFVYGLSMVKARTSTLRG